jgi:hypothetical protein
VPVGAYCCVTSIDGFDACSGSSDSSTSTQTVRVQLNGADELAEQTEVPLDTIFRFAGRFDSAQIIDAEGVQNPKCTAFHDVQGTKAVGKTFTTDITSFGKGVEVQSLRCSA